MNVFLKYNYQYKNDQYFYFLLANIYQMNFKDKYIKYKFKYLQLKYQYGGFPDDLNEKYMPPQLKSVGQKLKSDEQQYCIFYNNNTFKPSYQIKCDHPYVKDRNNTYTCRTDVA